MTDARRRNVLIAAAAAILLAFILIREFWPGKPFADLKQDSVISVDVSFGTYPEYQISGADQERLTGLLQTITVTKESDAYKQLSAKSYSDIFILHLAADRDISVEPFYPYLIIDGTGYQCNDRDALDAMSSIYDSYIDVIRQTSKPAGSH